MSHKSLIMAFLLVIVIAMTSFITYLIADGKFNFDNLKPVRDDVSLAPTFSDYPADSAKVSEVAGLDFSAASSAEKYKEAFLDSRENGQNVLAGTYRAVSLPCEEKGAQDNLNCYTLWIYDIRTGHILKVGANHYAPTELHLNSRLIKTGNEYYLVEGDSVRLLYVE